MKDTFIPMKKTGMTNPNRNTLVGFGSSAVELGDYIKKINAYKLKFSLFLKKKDLHMLNQKILHQSKKIFAKKNLIKKLFVIFYLV